MNKSVNQYAVESAKSDAEMKPTTTTLEVAFDADVKALGSESERPIILALKNWASNSEDHYDLVVDLHDLGAVNLARLVDKSYVDLIDSHAREMKDLIKRRK